MFQNNPFVKAQEEKLFAKVGMYGPPGTGKTKAALTFPKPAVIDMEGGSNWYGGKNDFYRLKTKSVQDVIDAIEWLENNPGAFETIIIDPVSILWSQLQLSRQEVKERKATRNKDEVTDLENFSGADWNAVKKPYRKIQTKLINLDMHVVEIARMNDQMETKANGQMVKVGVKPDAEKNFVYEMDTVFRTEEVHDTHAIFLVEKDRSEVFTEGQKIEIPKDSGAPFSFFAEEIKKRSNAPSTPKFETEEKAANKDKDLVDGQEAPNWPGFWTAIEKLGVSEDDVYKYAKDYLQLEQELKDLNKHIKSKTQQNQLYNFIKNKVS